LNNYHPDTKNVSFQQSCLIRYQTKIYDKRVYSLNIFSEEEQEFLQRYRWLQQWPEFFKPQELFSVVADNQAQEDTKRILQSFEIGSNKIRCTNAVALQALIPYVKRLLQLFPEVKEVVKSALSSDDIRNRVYEFETTHSLEKIKQSRLAFKPVASSLRDFLKSNHEQVLQLQMDDVDEWSGLVKVYQVLQKTGCLSEGQYTVLKLKRLLAMNHLLNLGTLMQSTETPHLILMACEDNQLLNDEAQSMISRLFNALKKKPKIKIILSTRSKGTTLHYLQQICRQIFDEGFVTRDEQLTWSDITSSFQEKLLKQSVKFQGANVSLNSLMSAETRAANLLPLGALLEERELEIGDPLPVSNVYNEMSYIGGTLRCQRAIKLDIFNDKDVKEFHVYLASTEQEFEQLCQQNPKSNVHWLEQDKSGKLLWLKSQGSLEKLREYIDTESSQTYAADNLDKLLEEAQYQRVMLISDTAGMGKSTILTHLSKQIKQKFPAKWLVRIDLNDHTDALWTLKQEQIDKEKAIEFVSERLLRLKSGLEMELFKQCFEQKQKVRVVIMLDGFDEISPFYKQTVTDLLQTLRQTAVEQLWVTTRPHLRNELEDKLQQLSYTIEPLPEENQVEFLTKVWSLRDWFTEISSKGTEESKKKLEIYAEELIKKLSQSISHEDKEFTSFPLHCRLLAEEFDEEVKSFCQSVESVPQLPFKLDLLGLYGRFIERKYDIYQEGKVKVQANNIIAREQRERDLKCMRNDHQLLALKVLFTEEQVALLQNYSRNTFSAEGLARIGIAEVNYEGKLHFIHRTLAEYYVADFFVNQLTKGTKHSLQLQDFLLKYIFVKTNYRVIRLFIDGLMSVSEPSQKVLKEYGNLISDLWKDGVLILHQAAREGNAHIIRFLSDSLQVAEHTDTLIQLLLAQDNDTPTAWHMAAECGNLELLQMLWELAKQKLTPEDLNNKLLLAKDSRGQTAWHVAAEWGNLQILQKLWEWAKEGITEEVISDELLLARDDNEQTFLHVAAKRNNTKEFEKVWYWATEKLSSEEIRKLLLAKDSHELTVLHMGANKFNPKLLEELLNWATENLTPQETKMFAKLSR
jgi:ankyrin repeat protein